MLIQALVSLSCNSCAVANLEENDVLCILVSGQKKEAVARFTETTGASGAVPPSTLRAALKALEQALKQVATNDDDGAGAGAVPATCTCCAL